MSLYQKLDADDQRLVAPVLVNNCIFCHPEHLLLVAVADEDQRIRTVACERILKARSQAVGSSVRTFDKNLIPVNLSASCFMDLIDWEKINVTSPPLLDHLDSKLLSGQEIITVPKYPCHSQAVERNIRNVTSVCGNVFGHDSLHEAVLQMK